MTKPDFADRSSPAIAEFRGRLVVMDSEVAALFGVETRRLNEQVNRNAARFGDDFAFQLTAEEFALLISQSATSKGRGGRRKPPVMFTEHGVVMAATLLRSEQAIAASRFIVRGFVESRRQGMRQHPGRNLPIGLQPIATEERRDLALKLDAALSSVLDAIATPERETSVRDEARAVAMEGLGAIKAQLRKQGVQNEHRLAEIQKLLKEAEVLDTEIAARHVETEHRRLALVAKQLRITIELQRFLEQGDADGLLAVLRDLGGA